MSCGVSIPRIGRPIVDHSTDPGRLDAGRHGSSALAVEAFGSRVRRLRRRAGYTTQAALGDVLGCKAETISRWETHICAPSLLHTVTMCRLFGVTLDFFVFGADIPPWGGRSNE